MGGMSMWPWPLDTLESRYYDIYFKFNDHRSCSYDKIITPFNNKSDMPTS